MKKLWFAVVVLVMSGLVLAACGGGGEETSTEFEISLENEFSFDPDVISVKAGETITVTFENTGRFWCAGNGPSSQRLRPF